MHVCMIRLQRKHGGSRFTVEESQVDTVSGETRALITATMVLNEVPKPQPLLRIS